MEAKGTDSERKTFRDEEDGKSHAVKSHRFEMKDKSYRDRERSRSRERKHSSKDKKRNKEKKSRREHKRSKKKSDKKHRDRRKRERADDSSSSSSESDGNNDTGPDKISLDDYFSKSQEFRVWLKVSKGRYFEDLSSDEAHKLFSKDFVPAFNKGSLPEMYYSGMFI
jgi:hypothetical protein